MKFGNKYELFEAVTNGCVETFVAKALVNGERVLVHIFEAPEQRPDQPTVQWVLESFGKVAPTPPGHVVETGRYGTTAYAYLVTSLPDIAALQRWTDCYKSHGLEAQETQIRPASPPRNSAASARLSESNDLTEAGSIPPASKRGDFTEAFLRPPRGGPQSETRTCNGTEKVVGREPGDFTRQFSTGPKVDPAKSADSSRVNTADETASTDPGGFTAIFQSSFNRGTSAPESIHTRGTSEDRKAGDFTSFFQGPFGGGRPAETPNLVSNSSNLPLAKSEGDFTRVFGSGKDSPFATPPPSEALAGDDPLAGGARAFTGPTTDAGRLTADKPPLPAWEAKAKSEPSPLPKEMWSAPITPLPIPVFASDDPAIPGPTANINPSQEARLSVHDGATRAFSQPARDPASNQPPLPAGPSEYTRIISGGMRNVIPPEAPGAGGSHTPPGGVPAFSMPAPHPVPPVPVITPPQVPRIQQSPMATPPAPVLPSIGTEAPKGKMPYLPVIIILNVLLILAILLIVYFAIKH